jgi:DNA-binding NtrC family response regulator
VWLARVPKPVRKGSVSLRELSASAAEQTEKELILRTLNEVTWNRKRAAKQLNICYKSLLNKMHRWQLRSQAAGGPSRIGRKGANGIGDSQRSLK